MEYETAIDAVHNASSAAANRLGDILEGIAASVLKAGYEYTFVTEQREVRAYSEQGWRLHTVVPPYATSYGNNIGPVFIMERYRDEV